MNTLSSQIEQQGMTGLILQPPAKLFSQQKFRLVACKSSFTDPVKQWESFHFPSKSKSIEPDFLPKM
jgi:hypothetical protein